MISIGNPVAPHDSYTVFSTEIPHSCAALIAITRRAESCFIGGEYPPKPYHTGYSPQY